MGPRPTTIRQSVYGEVSGSNALIPNIKWTSKNVENLGVFFGNDGPALATFQKLLPKVTRSMNYRKQFRLSKLAKARVIEIFHASKLWYAACFYPIPFPSPRKTCKKRFSTMLIFPSKMSR